MPEEDQDGGSAVSADELAGRMPVKGKAEKAPEGPISAVA